MLKVAILGANGQLGRELVKVFGDSAIPYERKHVDFKDSYHIRDDAILHNKANIIINAVAENNVDAAEQNPRTHLDINAWAVTRLAGICADTGTRFIHFSTDYVFDGAANKPYYEDAAPNPINNYGRSKLMGEMGALAVNPKAAIIRTAGLYGYGGSRAKNGNFVERILRKAQHGGKVKVVVDQVTSPTFAKDLAKAVFDNVEVFYDQGGIYHLTNDGECDWFRFAQQFVDADQLQTVHSEDLNLPAKRPKYSVLKNTRLPLMRHWEDALEDYLYGIR